MLFESFNLACTGGASLATMPRRTVLNQFSSLLCSIGLSVCLLGSTTLVGCASTDADRARTEGAAVGAILGAVIGGLTGNRDMAAAGAVLGGAAGLAVGQSVAQRKAEYEKREDHLRAVAFQAQQATKQARDENERLRGVIDQLKQAEKRLQTETMTENARSQLIAANRRAQAESIQRIDQAIATVRKQIAVQESEIKMAREAEAQAQQQASARKEPAPQQSEYVNLVALRVSDLQTQQGELLRLKAQLELIDARRSY